jgi:hypothetical protein
MGTFGLDADDYTLAGTTKNFEFCCIGNVDSGGVTGEVTLYNLTASVVAAVLTFTGTTSPTKQVVAASITTFDQLYEVRARVTVGVGVFYVQWAGLRVNNVII